PIESKRPQERPEPTLAAAASKSAAEISASQSSAQPSPRKYAVQRKAERVSMSGTNAYAMLGERGARRARVLDLGFGGVAIEFKKAEESPTCFLAVLPGRFLPPVRVSLKPVWSQRTAQGAYRVGCAFVS